MRPRALLPAAALLLATAAHAEPPYPTTDFRGDWRLEGEGMGMSAEIRYSAASRKIRLDMAQQGMAMSSIHDMAAGEVLTWSDGMPGMAMRISTTSHADVEMEETGETRTVNGRDCTVWQVAGATACLTSENIPLQTDGEGFSATLENLEIASQDPAEFELPAGLQVMDMPTGMPGMEQMMPGGDGMGLPF